MGTVYSPPPVVKSLSRIVEDLPSVAIPQRKYKRPSCPLPHFFFIYSSERLE
jgi:hypothetical protein